MCPVLRDSLHPCTKWRLDGIFDQAGIRYSDHELEKNATDILNIAILRMSIVFSACRKAPNDVSHVLVFRVSSVEFRRLGILTISRIIPINLYMRNTM
jgi:hypothetical protein